MQHQKKKKITVRIDQAPLPMEFSRQEYWSGDLPSWGDLSNPGIKPGSPALQADYLLTELSGKPLCVHLCVWKHMYTHHIFFIHSSVDGHLDCLRRLEWQKSDKFMSSQMNQLEVEV